VPPDRDLAAFEARATRYERGWLGRLHHDIADRTADLALATQPHPQRVLDVGCGTGYLLRSLASRCPDARELAGIDPAPSMIRAATVSARDDSLKLSVGVAEQLPYSSGTFDLVVSSTSFDHWSDQQAGLCECARVLQPEGHLVLVDQFSFWLAPTLLASRRGKARTKRRASGLLATAGFQTLVWHDLYAVIIKAVTATPDCAHDRIPPSGSAPDGRG
jgi:ubiquinone/menaquinone biosynthesis C-methylase UbiE